MQRLDREPRLNHLTVSGPGALGGGGRRLAWWEWPSDRDDHIVICVHGLSRQGRDFDSLARSIAGQARVVAVDVAARRLQVIPVAEFAWERPISLLSPSR